MIARGRLGLRLRLSLWLGFTFRRHNIERIALLLLMPWLARLTPPARLTIAVLVAVAILVTIAIAIAVPVPVILVAIIIVVALFNPVTETLIAVISHIIIVILDLVVRPGITAWLVGLDEAEIMLGVLVEILGSHAVARQHRIARQLNVFVKNLGSIATDFDFRTIALIAAIGRIARLPPTAALALIIARPCFPAIHI